MKTPTAPSKHHRKRGFERASGLLDKRIRQVGETRGFAVSRLLTHWADIVGHETAQMAQPVKISYGRGGIGATLTVLTTGANAPMLQAGLPKIREAVNRCYGYSAISHIRITQTAATGFAEGKAVFLGPKETTPPTVDPMVKSEAAKTAGHIANKNLRTALEQLGTNVLTRAKSKR